MKTGQFAYDAVPYPSLTFPQTHPDRLAVMAVVNGMQPAPADRCRMLELGCGDGTNLLSIAYALPDCSFTGIDLSATHIARAEETRANLGLANVEFRCGDVTEVNATELGEFDYIAAHGLFSWVPGAVRGHILRIYKECLAPNGVGYISYNAYPGCRIREIAFGIMRFQADNFPEPFEKVEQGLAMLDLVAESAEKDSLYQQMLRLEVEQTSERSASNIFHDDLSELNQPFYFNEFAEMLGENSLQFLSEVDPASSNAAQFRPETRALLESLAGDVIMVEQYIDFIKCRRFRSSLLCRGGVPLERNPSQAVVDRFYISSQITPEGEADLSDGSIVHFRGTKDAGCDINHPLTKAALVRLGAIWPNSCPIDELFSAADDLLGVGKNSADDRERTRSYLLQLFRAGFVKFSTMERRLLSEPGAFPEASRFARWQIEQGSATVTTLAGMNMEAEDLILRAMILLLDGTRDRDSLIAALKDTIEVNDSDQQAFHMQLPAILDVQLNDLANAGLLIA